ncbi:MAG: amino acid permease [Chlamydiales bacterium]|nr:amino acid permease [Chlamydiales bacterium]
MKSAFSAALPKLKKGEKQKSYKFGTLKGVFLPNILQMIGVILFLRLGWILGQVGIFETTVIITLSSFLLFVTGLSLTAIATNMKIGAGGSYYIISRSLGLEFGSSIGILLCISQTTSVALCVSGFAVSLQEFLPHLSITYLEIGTICFLTFISYVSTNLALQTQIFIFCALAVSLGAIFLGDASNIPSTLLPADSIPHMPFWLAFAMFFPAATGIEAGLSMSGDLQKPSRSIPLGTIGAIVVAYILYINFAIFLHRNVSPAILVAHPFIVYNVTKYGFLVVIGIWAATLSSALGGVLGAPRILQAVASDGILPRFLGKGFGKTNQPRIATLAIFIFALTLTVLTDINHLIPILTMVCLVTYGLLNFVAFFESFIQNPSWRPSFQVPWALSLVGSVGCFMTMFMVNSGATFIVLAAVIGICVWVSMRQLKGNWADIRFSLFSFLVNMATHRLALAADNTRNWRPNILAFLDTKMVGKRDLIAFTNALSQNKGFLTYALCLPKKDMCSKLELSYKSSLQEYLENSQVPAFCHSTYCESFIKGLREVTFNYGIGPLTPNTVVLFFKEELFEYEDIVSYIYEAHIQQKNVIFLKFDSEISSSFLEPMKGKGQKVIHLWWEGKVVNNFKLCLALSHIFQSSAVMHNANIFVNAIVHSEEERQTMEKEWEKYKKQLRMRNLNLNLLSEGEGDILERVEEESQKADLTFLGIKHPKKDELEEYGVYLRELFEKTKECQNLALVLSADKINYGRIFFS